jgi:hypothetical protein
VLTSFAKWRRDEYCTRHKSWNCHTVFDVRGSLTYRKDTCKRGAPLHNSLQSVFIDAHQPADSDSQSCTQLVLSRTLKLFFSESSEPHYIKVKHWLDSEPKRTPGVAMSIYNPWVLIIYCLSFACIYGAWKAKRKSRLDDLPGPKPESFILGTNGSFPNSPPLR